MKNAEHVFLYNNMHLSVYLTYYIFNYIFSLGRVNIRGKSKGKNLMELLGILGENLKPLIDCRA